MPRLFALALTLLVSSSALARGNIVAPVVEPTSTQRAALAAHGFYIDPTQSAGGFHLGYNEIFQHDQPVYFTADAIAHALHASFDDILAELERAYLIDSLDTLVDELRTRLARFKDADATARADLELYLGVAAALLSEDAVASEAKPQPGMPAAALDLAAQLRKATGTTTIALFGAPMQIDESMFKPRGHYSYDPRLQRYFRAFTWLGRTELRLATREDNKPWEVNRRALAAARLLRRCFSARAQTAWTTVNRTLGGFVGPPDSMSFPGLGAGLDALHSDDGAAVAAAFEGAAKQHILSQLQRPDQQSISFIALGQRYVFDSDVLGSVVYGALQQKRMMPSPLDVGAAVFHNPEATRLLAPELKAYRYGDALAAVTRKGDSAGDALWHGSLGHEWLLALRGLSQPDRGNKLPWPLRGEAWNRRLLQSQLASWAELRRDTILYAKQSFTGEAMCKFPDAYVDPYPQFFAAMTELAHHAAALVEALPNDAAHAELRAHVKGYFAKFAAATTHLGAMAERERDGKPLLLADLDFMNQAVSIKVQGGGCVPMYTPLGWYADLYYDRSDVLWQRPTIADVHTQPTDADGNPVGRILSVATGRPRLIVIELPTSHGPQLFRGYVSSYYELTTKNYERLDDDEWTRRLNQHAEEVPWVTPLLVK